MVFYVLLYRLLLLLCRFWIIATPDLLVVARI